MKKYIGPYEVTKEKRLDDETCRVDFAQYTDDKGQIWQPPSKVFTYKMFNHLISETQGDFNSLYETMYAPLVNDILQLLLSYNINIGFRSNSTTINDLDYVFRLVERDILAKRTAYEDRLWGAEEQEKTYLQMMQGLRDISPDILELKIVGTTKKKIPKGK